MDSIQTRTLHSNYNSIAHYEPVDISTYITEHYGGNFETMLEKAVNGYLTDEKLASLLNATDVGGAVRIITGEGTPEGVVHGSIGTLYQDTSPRGALWFKRYGAGTTNGWDILLSQKGNIPDGYDVHNLTEGYWNVTSPRNASSLLNAPLDSSSKTVAIVEVIPFLSGKKFIRWTSYNPGKPTKSWVKFEIYSGWTDWSVIGGDSVGSGSNVQEISSGDLNTIALQGKYSIISTNVQNIPTNSTGILTVDTVGIGVIQTYINTSYTPKVYVRRITPSTSVYGKWVELSGGEGTSTQTLSVASGEDLNNITEPGLYTVIPSNITNRPIEANGVLEVMSLGIARIQRYTTVGYEPRTFTRRTTPNSSIYGEWFESGSTESVNSQYIKTSEYKNSLINKLSATKGGVIGTNGRAVVSLRFDDSATVFKDSVVSMLFDRGIPFTRVTTTERLESVPKDMDTLESIQNYTIKCGGEVWNHGMTHGNVSGLKSKKGFETVGALEKLRSGMPKLFICNYAPPGGSAVTYDGDFPLDSIEKLTETYSGKVITTNHAIASGYLEGTLFKSLDGRPKDGQRHFSADAYNLSRIKSIINNAVNTGTGVVLMYHPANFGETGYISFSEFEKILDYLVDMRKSDKIMLLTKSGMSFADIRYPIRHNLIKDDSIVSSDSPITIGFVSDTEGIQGSTREMVFKSTLDVQSLETTVEFIGSGLLSSKTHSIIDKKEYYRHCFTVPMDCSSIKISSTSPIDSVNIYCV